MMRFENKVAVVTGASRGIGAEVARELARGGAKVVVNYSGNEERAEEAVKQLEALGTEAFSYRADVANSEEVKAMMKETIDRFGQLDFLVNNAGITRDNLLMRMKEDEWDDVVTTNLKGVFLCTQAVTRQMMRQRAGKIVNVASIVGVAGNPGQANYVAAKAGVIGLTKTTAQELASRNILVNAVAPGFITTDMTEALPEKIKEGMLKMIPLAKLGEPQHVAKTVAILLSEDADYITGQTIHIDGGMVM